ncbi:hypothetical protein D3C76_1540460 [compost metagenome]
MNEFILFLQGWVDLTGWMNEDLNTFGPIWLWIASMGMALGIGFIWPRYDLGRVNIKHSEMTNST